MFGIKNYQVECTDVAVMLVLDCNLHFLSELKFEQPYSETYN